ncbi:hypothetical protein NODU109028_04220 [Nocardioides dubius]|uniref:DUF6891 domain-containing protein n=1 Tax=Nocardioides dubius TaxID=317019 RepID=A0ABN1TM16_9ACTN
MKKQRIQQELRDLARLLLLSGLDEPAAMRAELAEAIRSDLPEVVDAERQAEEWLADARRDAATDPLPVPSDDDRLAAAFAECRRAGLAVLIGVEDHWSAKRELERAEAAGLGLRGVLWFTRADVWHSIDAGMLEVNLWHSTTANAAPGDALLDEVVAILARHGLRAHFDEGRIEVAARWRRN